MWRDPRSWTELGLSVYLLTIPLGRDLPQWVREVPLLAVVAGMLATRWPRAGATRPPEPFRLLLPVALFTASTAMSTLLSERPAQSLSRAVFVPLALLLFLAVQDVATHAAARWRIRLVLLAVIVLLGVDGTYQFWRGASLLGGTPLWEGVDYRVTASLPNPNDLALVPILLPAALSAVTRLRRRWTVAILAGGLPWSLAATLLSGSRTAWLALGSGLAVFGLLGGTWPATLATAGATALLAVLALVLDLGALPERLPRALDILRDPRVGHWLVAWRLFKEAPLVGKGVHTFGEFYPAYIRTIPLPAGYEPEVGPIPWPHNIYLEILAERGVLGAATFAVLLAAMLGPLWRMLASRVPPATRAEAAGLAASLTAFLAAGLVDLTFLKDWVLLTLLLFTALVARLPCPDPEAPHPGGFAPRPAAVE